MKKLFNLQRFGDNDAATDDTPTTTDEANTTKTTDLAPAISIDLTSRMAANIQGLLDVISANELVPMPAGSSIKIYETKVDSSAKPSAQNGEGEIVELTKVKRTLKSTIDIALKKYRRQTTAEAIQKTGIDVALNQTDEVLLKAVQKELKTAFFTLLGTGTGTATAKVKGLQSALAAAWGEIQTLFDDIEATPIYFVSATDVAGYLSDASVTINTEFGMNYISNFLGLGDVFISPSLTSGTVIATAKENLYCAYVPANSDVSTTFGLISDESGLVGMTHNNVPERFCVDTCIMTGAKFYAEDLAKVVKVTIKTQ